MRDAHYTTKMHENLKMIDRELKNRKDFRQFQTKQTQQDNQGLARDRSEEAIKLAEAARKQDVKAVMADKVAAETIAMKERKKAEERRAGYQRMIKEYMLQKKDHQESQFNGLQPLELKLNR